MRKKKGKKKKKVQKEHICPVCGNPIQPGAKECRFCGTNQENSKETFFV